ncbi:hypothetical protein [Cellvibrio sp. UBA7671]|uniref:hypothetical protein n=1 Tax=Cellvibrio sp. UBA7671 TaxID=1946312 RepID=UPI002F354553
MTKRGKFIYFGLIATSALIIINAIYWLIHFYLKSSNVLDEQLGGPAEFGQFGDMIGGILNPVFGFITTIVVLYTLYLELESSKNNELVRQRNELHDYLIKALKQYDEEVNKKQFNNQSFLDRYTINNLFNPEMLGEYEQAFFLLDKYNKNHKPIPPTESNPIIRPLGRIQLKQEYIIRAYVSLIKIHDIGIIKAGLAMELLGWIKTQREHRILSGDESEKITDQVMKLFPDGAI